MDDALGSADLSKKAALCCVACWDVVVDAVELMHALDRAGESTAGVRAMHHDEVDSVQELSEMLAYFFSNVRNPAPVGACLICRHRHPVLVEKAFWCNLGHNLDIIRVAVGHAQHIVRSIYFELLNLEFGAGARELMSTLVEF